MNSFESSSNIPENSLGDENESQNEVSGPGSIEEEPDSPLIEETPEFSEEKIDKERLRTAIEIALEGERPIEREEQERREAEKEKGERELRNDIARAEAREDEKEVLRLEAVLAEYEKAKNKEKSAPNIDTEKIIESAQEPESTIPKSSNTESVEPTGEQKPRVTMSYDERLTAMAKERDPLGLAKVALRETLGSLGKKEKEYMKLGPFERLDPTGKLEVVRENEEYKKKNIWMTDKEYDIYLKGLIYNALESEEKRQKGISEERVAQESGADKFGDGGVLQPSGEAKASGGPETPEEASIEQPKEKEVAQDMDGTIPEVAPEDLRQESQNENIAAESDSEKELKRALVLKALDTLRARVKEITLETSPEELEKRMQFFDTRTKYMHQAGVEGENARKFLALSLERFVEEKKGELTQEEFQDYKKVLEIFQNEKELEYLKIKG